MHRGTPPEGVPVSLVLYPEHRAALWALQMRRGYASMSAVVRDLVRTTDIKVAVRMQAFLSNNGDQPLQKTRPQRPSVLLRPTDVERLDRLAKAAGASSRSAAVRFLIRDAADSTETRMEISPATTTETDAA